MLSEVSPLEDCPAPVQFVGHGCAVDFHTGRENDQVEPLADHREEEFDMGAQMDEKADRLVVDCDLAEKIHEIESNKVIQTRERGNRHRRKPDFFGNRKPRVPVLGFKAGVNITFISLFEIP
jgi:hypothetical protein